jgi:hypothetical protein
MDPNLGFSSKNKVWLLHRQTAMADDEPPPRIVAPLETLNDLEYQRHEFEFIAMPARN